MNFDIEESMRVKFEESNSLVKNIIEIEFLDKDFEKIFMKDSPTQEGEDKKKDDTNDEDHNIEVETTQLLPKNWRDATNHPKDLIIGDVCWPKGPSL